MRAASPVMKREFDRQKLDFPFEGNLFEINVSGDKWLQTTRITFRSYDGPRRITDREGNVYDYDGPVYYYGSNMTIDREDSFKVIYLQDLELDEVNQSYHTNE